MSLLSDLRINNTVFYWHCSGYFNASLLESIIILLNCRGHVNKQCLKRNLFLFFSAIFIFFCYNSLVTFSIHLPSSFSIFIIVNFVIKIMPNVLALLLPHTLGIETSLTVLLSFISLYDYWHRVIKIMNQKKYEITNVTSFSSLLFSCSSLIFRFLIWCNSIFHFSRKWKQ